MQTQGWEGALLRCAEDCATESNWRHHEPISWLEEAGKELKVAFRGTERDRRCEQIEGTRLSAKLMSTDLGSACRDSLWKAH